ncbi:MAG: HAD family hydrolase [Candidatus Obscuribacterales bacterium]|nr:HAD family hydrolase [Candidatus Obscuribacterales bacterium]
MSTAHLLLQARDALYSISGGSYESNNVAAAKLTTAQRTAYFRSSEFRDWAAAEKAAGHEVFWLRDVDKTQAAGDIFTFFYKWRCDHNKFTTEGLAAIKKFLTAKRRKSAVLRAASGLKPIDALNLWLRKEGGEDGLSLLELWSNVYWPSQLGLTKEEKEAQVKAFAAGYAKRIYPGVPEENRTLEEAGVHVVIVSNGDQELAIAAAPYLGIKPENVTGSRLLYGTDGRATGVNHSYEVFGEEWQNRPQPGKHLSFHHWVHTNHKRWNWPHISSDRVVIAGRDGDSASADGGMMILLPPPAIGNFMIDTPGEPQRLQKFYQIAAKYGWTRGQFFTLVQSASELGSTP